jgi:NADH-quinone oxidoreductase subunit N
MDAIILKSFFPEIFFSLCLLAQLVVNSRLITNLSYNFPVIDKEVFIQTFFVLSCLLVLLINTKIEGYFSNFLFLNDIGNNTLKCFFVLSCIMILSTLSRGMIVQNLNFFEFFTIFSFSIFALLLLASAYDFISAYLVIEMQALCFYVLASFTRNSAFSTEAGLKYFISGSFISGLLLFGCSLVYGALGTLNFNSLILLLSFPLDVEFEGLKSMILIGVLFILISLLFKVAAAPFHFWSPDVYEGSPLSTTIIFSVVPKVIIFSFLIKCINTFSLVILEFQEFFVLIGIISVFWGTFFAIRQKRLKRLIIYSSIAQVGFLVAGLGTNSVDGFVSIYFFLLIYVITSVLIWNYITQFYSSQKEVNLFEVKNFTSIFLSNLSNYFKLDKISSASFILIFFSIAGIPPLSGFLSKIFILFGLIYSDFLVSSCIIVIISAVSAFYYLRIVKIIFFETKNTRMNNQHIQTVFPTIWYDFISCSTVSCLLLLIFLFLYPEVSFLGFQYLLLNTFGF